MKYFNILFLLLLQINLAQAQQVIASAGGYFQSENLSLSFTLGEPVIETFQNAELTLTQGFQQPYNFYLQQILNIPAGWSGVSTCLDPLSKGVEGMFSTFGNDFIILSSMTQFYYPAVGVNTIGNWNYESGYQVKAVNNLELTIAGSKLGNPTLELAQGWNLIPLLNNCNNPAKELFAPIIDHLQIVKEVAGTGVYWPQFGVNTLGVLNPGKAYFVLVDEEVELEFPACDLKKAAIQSYQAFSGLNTLSEFNVNRTPLTHTIAIPIQAISALPDNSILMLYNQYGLCCGATETQNQNLVLIAFGDDPTTIEVDGMLAGEPFIFHLFNPLTRTESALRFIYDEQMQNSGYFENHGLSAVKELEIFGVGENNDSQLNVSVFPNPSAGLFQVSTLINSNWEVLNTHGSIIIAGKNLNKKFTIDMSNNPKGIYYLKITRTNMQTIRKLVVQ